MSAAALTPRVRLLVLCDEVIESETEQGVFTLEGVRQHLEGGPFPLRVALNLFLVLFSARKGKYRGSAMVVQVNTDRSIRYSKFQVEFDELIGQTIEPEWEERERPWRIRKARLLNGEFRSNPALELP